MRSGPAEDVRVRERVPGDERPERLPHVAGSKFRRPSRNRPTPTLSGPRACVEPFSTTRRIADPGARRTRTGSRPSGQAPSRESGIRRPIHGETARRRRRSPEPRHPRGRGTRAAAVTQETGELPGSVRRRCGTGRANRPPQSHEQRQQRDRGGVRPHGGVARRRERNGENGPYRGPEGPPRDGRTASKAPQPTAYREQPQPAAKDRRHGQGDVLAADETEGPPPADREEVDPGAQGPLRRSKGWPERARAQGPSRVARGPARRGGAAPGGPRARSANPCPPRPGRRTVGEVRVQQPRQRGTQEAAERCTQEEGGRDGHACDREPAKRTLARKGESRDERRQYEHRARTRDEGGGDDAQSQGWYPRGQRRARESAESQGTERQTEVLGEQGPARRSSEGIQHKKAQRPRPGSQNETRRRGRTGSMPGRAGPRSRQSSP